MRVRLWAVFLAGALLLTGTFVGGCSEVRVFPLSLSGVSSGHKGADLPPLGGENRTVERPGGSPSSGTTESDGTLTSESPPSAPSSSEVPPSAAISPPTEEGRTVPPSSHAKTTVDPAAAGSPPSGTKAADGPKAGTSSSTTGSPPSGTKAADGPKAGASSATADSPSPDTRATGDTGSSTPQPTTGSRDFPSGNSANEVFPLGASYAEVAAVWGTPTWQGTTPYREVFWAYEREGKFRRGVYFLSGRAESFVLGAGERFLDWRVDTRIAPPKSTVSVAYRGVSLRVNPMPQDFGIFLTASSDGRAAVELFVDHAAGDKLLYLRISRWERILRERLYPVSLQYTPPRPEWLTEALGASPAYGDDVLRTEERYLAGLIRDFRLRNGLSPLAWDEAVARAAKGHSIDMLTNGFFAHLSPTNGTLADRLARVGVSYTVAGENISRGFDDALEMHIAFLNSPGHRQNVVFPEYTRLGTGMAGTYMTVDFIGR